MFIVLWFRKTYSSKIGRSLSIITGASWIILQSIAIFLLSFGTEHSTKVSTAADIVEVFAMLIFVINEVYVGNVNKRP